jgi:tRNA modification GTPase
MKFVRTITALVTAPVAQNVALIRLAGPATYSIINKIFQRSNHRPLARKRGINFGQIITADGEVVDQVLLFCFVAPHSFTGEDLVEISCHGNIFIVNRIIEMLVKEGADLATAGEFSKQAFFNGKLNLIQAQAINELIRAPGAAATQLALDNLSPAKQQVINVIEDRLLSLIANIKVNIDYPEYDGVEYLTGKNSRQELQRIRQQITAIQQQSDNTDVFRQGLQVAIVGQPNVGKSTLLNSLTKTEKAFVSAQQGTTRDAIEVTHSLNGIPLSLVDTAGIRVATDEVEKIGIARSKAILDTAEFVLFVIDATRQ